MAPGLKQLFKRQVAEEGEGDEGVEEETSETTTLQTVIFGKHLHKVKITTPTTTLETDGRYLIDCHLIVLNTEHNTCLDAYRTR